MPKAKKKRNQTGHQKQVNAQQNNEFLNKLRNSFKTIVGEDVFKFIPSNDYKLLIYGRARPIIAVSEKGQSIPPKIIEAIQLLINFYIKKEMMPAEFSLKPISIIDFYTTGLTFSTYCTYLENNDIKYKNADQVKTLISNSNLELNKQFDILYDKLVLRLFPFLIQTTNSFWEGYFSYRFNISNSEDVVGLQYQVVVKQHELEKRQFLLSDSVRPAFRIGWTFKDNAFEWISLLPSELGIKSLPEDQQIPVYIQSHAIQRIFERLDCIHRYVLISSIYLSIGKCVCIKDRGKFIIEFVILDVKVGYLSAVMSEGKLVIRTFLFLTFNGTPEGKRLEEFIGLKALDTKYLKMDKLSSFMTGKLKENDELRAIFEKADCLHLVELYDKLDKFSEVHPDHSPVEMLTRYLETEK
ncbi:MAG: hypothetical protein K0M40_09545 [Prolixibacteraceae bacterium]|nr:hypothetical protein [Prolixibacteraceae bacterium]